MEDNKKPYNTIKSFHEIQFTPKTLYVLDFDDTIAKFDGIHNNWWTERFEFHYEAHSCFGKAEELSLYEWKEKVELIEPVHVDEGGLNYLIEHCSESGSHFVILTARNKVLKDMTNEHLNKLLPDHNIDVIYCSFENKGLMMEKYIEKELSEHEFEHIVFIDDKEYNLDAFMSHHPDATCYLMEDCHK
jgi:hypothetical protein